MCNRVHGITILQAGEQIKADCSISTGVLFLCGPQTYPLSSGNKYVLSHGPHNLTLVMESGSEYLHTNAGGVNQLDVTCGIPPSSKQIKNQSRCANT